MPCNQEEFVAEQNAVQLFLGGITNQIRKDIFLPK